MKKLLVLALVLGMASLANAGIVVFGPQVPDEITLHPSDELVIDIMTTSEATLPSYGGWILMQGQGQLGMGNGKMSNATATLWLQSTVGNMSDRVGGMDELASYVPLLGDLGYGGVFEIIEWDIKDTVDPISPIPLNQIVIGHLVFHCEGPGDVILTLMDLDLNVFDAITIHQIPEPASMLLLGLGGLFLRRRK